MSRTAPASTATTLKDGDRAGVMASIVEATKPRITRLVAITSGVGFLVAALDHKWDALQLALSGVGAIVGTVLSAGGANALNQWFERDRDALMVRTCSRPLPQQRLMPRTVLMAGLLLSIAGVAVLLALCGVAPALVSLSTILIYVLIYTPLKPVTPWATQIGAIPGALPPLIGFSAASAHGAHSLLEPGVWTLFAIMFIWQIPHFLAIAWMYRDDYATGGYKVLPVVDPSGKRTARSILIWGVLLIPASMSPMMLMKGVPAIVFGVLSAAMAAAFLMLCVKLTRTLARPDARRAFFASIIHLPLLLVTVVACCAASALL